jgi:hypothetical protein
MMIPMKRPLLPSILAFLAITTLAGCTPAARQQATTDLNVVGAGAPVACSFLSGNAGTVCGQVSAGVSAVTKLVESILAALPAGRRGDAAPGFVEFIYQGSRVTVRAGLVLDVKAGLGLTTAGP